MGKNVNKQPTVQEAKACYEHANYVAWSAKIDLIVAVAAAINPTDWCGFINLNLELKAHHRGVRIFANDHGAIKNRFNELPTVQKANAKWQKEHDKRKKEWMKYARPLLKAKQQVLCINDWIKAGKPKNNLAA